VSYSVIGLELDFVTLYSHKNNGGWKLNACEQNFSLFLSGFFLEEKILFGVFLVLWG